MYMNSFNKGIVKKWVIIKFYNSKNYRNIGRSNMKKKSILKN